MVVDLKIVWTLVILASGYATYRFVLQPFLQFVKALTELNARLAKADPIPGYVKGLVKVCEAHVAAVERQTEAVNALRSTIFAEAATSESGRAAAPNYSIATANRVWASAQIAQEEPELSLEEVEELATSKLEHGEVATPGF